METTRCTHCGQLTLRYATRCNHCGTALSSAAMSGYPDHQPDPTAVLRRCGQAAFRFLRRQQPSPTRLLLPLKPLWRFLSGWLGTGAMDH